MNKVYIKRFLIYALLLFSIVYSQKLYSQKISWQPATAYYKDGTVLKGKLKSKNNNFWYFLLLKTADNPKIYLYPEEVDEVICNSYRFISFKYIQDDFNHSTYSFAHVLAGDYLVLVRTRYSKWVCNCSKGERYFWGWFIISGSEYIELYFDREKLININDVHEFLINNQVDCSPEQVNNMEGIKQLLNRL